MIFLTRYKGTIVHAPALCGHFADNLVMHVSIHTCFRGIGTLLYNSHVAMVLHMHIRTIDPAAISPAAFC